MSTLHKKDSMLSTSPFLRIGSISESGRKIIGYDKSRVMHKRYEIECVKCKNVILSELNTWRNNCKKCGSIIKKDEDLQDLRYQIFYKYKYNAGLKNNDFDLSFEYFCKLLANCCHYCGDEPSRIFKSHRKRKNSIIYNGIDRVDNSIGYFDSNTVSCCTNCNFSKKAYSIDEFKIMVKKWNDRADSW
jgi:hypothetical protein